MWEKVYAGLVIAGALTTIVYGIVSLVNNQDGFALGYTLLLVFGSALMWIVGSTIFNRRSTEDENNG